MADEEVKGILEAWGLPELLEPFADAGVDLDCFTILDEKFVNEILPPAIKRATVFKFWKKYRQTQESNSTSTAKETLEVPINVEFVDCEIVVDGVVVDSGKQQNNVKEKNAAPGINCTVESNVQMITAASSSREPLEEATPVQPGDKLRAVLGSSVFGRSLLKRAALTPQWREQLASDVAYHLLLEGGCDKIFRKEEYHVWATEITTVFPLEAAGTYYVPYCKGPPKCMAKGLLVNKINLHRRKLHTLEKTTKQASEAATRASSEATSDVASEGASVGATESSEAAAPAGSPTIETLASATTEENEKVNFLKKYYSPWDTVLVYWKDTFQYRMNWGMKEDIANAIKTFRPLQDDRVNELVEIDFRLLHENSATKLLVNWFKFVPGVLKVARVLCQKELDYLADQDLELTECEVSLLVLPHLFKTATAPKKGSELVFRPNNLEKLETFITCLKTYGEIKENYDARRNLAFKRNTTVQPFVYRTGLPSDETSPGCYYMCLNGEVSKTDSLLQAVDLCFKTFFVFQTAFPPECSKVWQLLQHMVYKITDHKQIHSKVFEVMTDILLCSTD